MMTANVMSVPSIAFYTINAIFLFDVSVLYRYATKLSGFVVIDDIGFGGREVPDFQ
jgi:hypothetical protein